MTAVVLGETDAAWLSHLDDVAARASAAGDNIDACLHFAREVGSSAPLPGSGRTRELWELLATAGAADLTCARVLEPHLDALAILDQAGLHGEESSTWGVYAAEGPGVAVTARASGDASLLDGTKPWCSLAGVLDRALITAHTGKRSRRLFSVDLRNPGIAVDSGGWFARGLTNVQSESVTLAAVPATPVGDDEWYLRRPGFAWGGMGVAAVWFGGAVALARSVAEKLSRRELDQIGALQLGRLDLLLHAGRTVLSAAAAHVDSGGGDIEIEAQRVRSTVAHIAEEVLTIAGHTLGPAPLALDDVHARRVADLTLYVRQDHAERDVARLGTLIGSGEAPW
ncbi:alkylation response protein AidB-like acyl-CoA dehydrogenase [Microbacteriaceae bacterium SG_E_30_P1]|uniref:Alkylation response protein AidB-like acyl-CoA dehydrogenase n=1 Tax=Antiquaquibacter oligotrophicus TaxID=2880260 RepID=A0ABT6KSU9_9MICO|nr:hypothetical protein [Antiquaquibacter oligotrophicus]MDH6182127.1 alkylation response protein AidB-like acyl-CoA dehydrogenase [Antiquaquibacter oligotrophicus]UDF12210.1 hypothetical protein LH407_08525 [Antiquaquibacter oligotrophicus]